MAGRCGWDVKIVCGSMEWHVHRIVLVEDSMFFRERLTPVWNVRTG